METWMPSPIFGMQPTDLIIVVEGCKFFVHKDVLMQNCDYFKAMFSSQMSENLMNEISIKIVGKDPFQILVEGFYSGRLHLSEESVFVVSVAAHVLQVTSPLFTQCCGFLKKMINHVDCFEVMKFVTVYPIQDVYDSARRYCLQHFLSLREEQSFLSLTWNDLREYLCDDYLITNETWEVLVALKNWIVFNKTVDYEDLKKVVCACLRRKEQHLDECENIASAIVNGDDFVGEKWSHLGSRWQKKDTFMFWAHLSKTKVKGLVDVVKFDDLEEHQSPIQGSRFDSMTCIVEDPGIDLGSAVCVLGPYVYLCGGGPSFGRMNWIRDIWVFDAFHDKERWRTIGKLPETRRYHAMVALGKKLYVFGGFGKFRSKNSCLESFDINDGSWQPLAPMPKHEFKPIATSHHQAIYYITQEWKVYVYCVNSNQWSGCERLHAVESLANPARGQDINTPLALHITSSESNSSLNFTVTWTSGKSVQIVSYPLTKSSKTFNNQQLNDSKYFGSFSMNGRVFIFLRSRSENVSDDEGDESFEEGKDIEVHVMSFEPETNELKEVNIVTNVNKCSSIVPVPYLPKSFKVVHHDNGLSF